MREQKYKSCCFLFVAFLFVTVKLFAQPYEGTSCANAVTIYSAVSGSCASNPGGIASLPLSSNYWNINNGLYSNTLPSTPSCWSSVTSGIVWQKFTPTSTATYTFAAHCVSGGSGSNDVDIAIYTGSCGALTLLPGGCQNGGTSGGCPNLSLSVSLTAGTTYYIATQSGDNKLYGLCVTGAPSLPSAPSNDNCSGATALTLNTPVNGTLISATSDKSLCGGYATNGNVWYTFTPTSTGNHYLQLYNANCAREAGFDVSIYSGGINCSSSFPGTCVATNTSSVNDDFQVTASLTAGTTYYINIDGTGTQCDFKLKMTTTPCTTPTTAAAGSDQAVCGTVATLNGNNPTVGTGTWTVISGTGVFSNPNSYTTTVSGMSTGANIYQWSITNSPCAASSDLVTVTSVTAPTTSNAGSDKSVCGSSTTLAANTPTTGTGVWSLVSGAGTIASTTSASTTVTGLGSGVSVFQWTISNSPCTASSSQIAVTSISNPTTAAAGTDQSVCQGTNVTLAGNNPTSGSGQWSVVSGSGTITSFGVYNTTVTSLGVGTNVLQWTVSNSPCTASTDQVSIVVAAPPSTANAGADITICSSGTSANLPGVAPTSGTGVWTVVSGGANLQTPTSPTTHVSSLQVGANVFQWTVSNAPCPSTTDQVTLNRILPNTNSDAGSDQTVCGSSATLSGSSPITGSGTWTLISGTGIITSPTSPTTTVTALSPGLNVFQWTITAPPCDPLTDQVNVYSVPTPTTANAGTDQIVCSTTATLAGNTPTYGTGTWTLVSGSGVIANPASPNSTVSGLGVGANVFQWTITNSPCTPSSDQVTITNSGLTVSVSSTTNTACGGSSGSGTVTSTGGTGGITYSWATSPIQTGVTATGLAAGVYTVTATDAQGCTATTGVTINNTGSPPVPAATGTNVSCYGGTNGTASVTVSGGSPAYTYSWSTGASGTTTTSVTGLAAGTYTVSVRDALNCLSSTTITITQPTYLDAAITASANVSCNGGTTGSATVTASGGTGTLSYSWSTSPSSSTAAVTGLSATTYTVKVTDANGCTNTETVTITQPTLLTASISASDHVLCFGESNGSATVLATGGTGNYTYSWNSSPVQTNSVATGLPAGTYSVVITDDLSCSTTVSTNITQPTVLTSNISASTNISCNAGSNGTATVSVSGGTVTYTYFWNSSPAQTTISATGLASGSYTVFITDANGCTSNSTVTLTQPAVLTSSVSASVNNICYGGTTGTATASASGGTSAYSYSWSTSPSQSSITATGLAAGSYTVKVTDALGCTSTSTVTITEPEIIALSISSTVLSCFGEADGTATVASTGGTGSYTYSWSTSPSQTTATATGLVAGTYTVKVTDGNACSMSGTVTLVNPTVLDIVISSQTNISCNGGSNGVINSTATGGTGSYIYSWNTTPIQTGTSATGLPIGTYSVVVTDAKGCTDVVTATLTSPTALSGSATISNVSCNAGTNGSINFTASGGAGTYSYSWNSTPSQTNSTATGLVAATYSVVVTDLNGCTYGNSYTVTQPAALSLTTSSVNAVCGVPDGTATVAVTGGVSSYTYSWNSSPSQTTATATDLPSGLYNVLVTDANGCTKNGSVAIDNGGDPSVTISASTNVLCFGGTNGTATALATGGVGTIYYTWNTTPAQNTAVATGLIAGTYIVSIKDDLNCANSATVTITQPTALAVTTSKTDVTCYNGNNGSASVTPSGGSGIYTYSWNTTPVQTTASATGLTSGNYTATVTDANGCSITANFTIANAVQLVAIITPSPVSCFGGSNGSATLTAGGGNGTLTYSWSTTPSQTSLIATGLSAGTYSVLVTDANSCTITTSTTITEPTVLASSISASTNVSCNAGTNGTATINASGGTTNYTYSWSTTPSQTNTTATGLASGTYTVKTTDANGCTITSTVTITEPNILASSISSSTNVSCNAGSNGTATVNASGGTTNYTYSWSTTPSQTNTTATGLSAGTYTVKTTDANGCTITSTVTITEPAILASTISSSTNVSCNAGANGSATVSASGGTTNYTYSWSTIPSQTNVTATGLSAGTYTVKTTDANGCTITSTVTITQPTILASTISSSTNVSCNAGTNGTATVNANGGTTNYTYSWSTTPSQTTITATGLSAGTYTVKTTDANGCTITSTVTITEPAILASSISSSTNVSCNAGSNGTATVNASGGTTNYTYSWSTTPSQTNTTATGLAAGTYTVKTTDANGCTITSTVTITEPSVLASNISSSANVSCNAGNNGTATVNASGGTTNYTYSWSTTPSQTNTTATGLAAGTYTVKTTDANGCTITSTVTITQPTILASTISSSTNVSCNAGANGSATVSASGGTTNYTYSWSITPSQTNTTATGLSAGTYTVKTTDANACTITSTVTITEPTILASSISSSTNVSCNAGTNGTATVNASGGTTNYTYSWSTTPSQTTITATGLSAGTYTVKTTDANGCTITSTVTITEPTILASSISSSSNVGCNAGTNGTATVSANGGTINYTYSWSTTPSQTNTTATGLSAGTYTVKTTDANGCTITSTVTITEPAILASTISSSMNVSCNAGANGSATVSASGGTTNYMYSWSTTPSQSIITATGLSAGTYTVKTTDANGCTITSSVTITEPTLLTSSISSSTNVGCNAGTNGTATVSASGGTTNYTYSWSTTPSQTNTTATGLSAGTYTVKTTDANGCTITSTVTITQPTILASTISLSTNVSCNAGTNGSATVSASGGTINYTYSWSTAPSQTNATATGLSAGTYTVKTTDANGCTITSSVTITEPTLLTSSITSNVNANCFGAFDGNATVSPIGGTTNYTYSWSTLPSQTNATATGLAAWNYTVLVTDANGCTTSSAVTITEPTEIVGNVNSIDATCGVANGTASVTSSGGTGSHTYSWNTTPAQTGTNATGLAAGIYSVTVTDANGCTKVVPFSVNNGGNPLVSMGAYQDVLCNGATTGSATVNASGGTGTLTYSWNTTPVQTTSTATGLGAGTYIVIVNDGLGCANSAQVTITEPTMITASVSAVNLLCNGLTNGNATISSSGGTGAHTYSWSTTPSQTNVTATGLSAGTYTVKTTDANGCTIASTVALTEPTVLISNISSSTNVSCNAGNNGSATVNASGGTTNYTYSWSTSPSQTNSTATGLSAGTYTVKTTDANGCTITSSVTITEPSVLTSNISSSTNVSCNAGSNGTATVNASGGTTNYTYSWSTTPSQTNSTATGLSAGTYTVKTTDSNGCTITSTVAITEPTILASTISASTNVSCNAGTNGTATVNVSGGTTNYTYSWSTTPSQTNTTATGLAAGTYTVKTTDVNGCTITSTVTITEPNILTSSISSSTNVSCNAGANGTATVNVSGGTTNYTYSWSTVPSQTNVTATGLTAGTYTVKTTDANGCTITSSVTITEPSVLTSNISSSTNVSCNAGSNGTATVNANGGTTNYTYSWSTTPSQTNSTATGLSAGTYTVKTTDSNGCTITSTVAITEPTILASTISASTNVSCNAGTNGTATVNASGGTTNYTYSWSTTPSQTNVTATGLSAGTYTIKTTDANGCTIASTVTITEPTILISNISSSTNVSCNAGNNGSATVSVVGGTTNYTYSWSTTPSQSNTTATGLSTGTYTVKTTDANGCTITSTVTITEPSVLTSSITSNVNANCFGAFDGSATVSPIGGTTNYTYSWSTLPSQTNATATGLAAWNYTVLVTDANGCTTSSAVTVTEPTDIVGNVNSVDATCGVSNGTANITSSGGTGAHTYSWNISPAQTGTSATGLAAGIYSVTITDANACTKVVAFSVNNGGNPLVSMGVYQDVLCNGASTGSATVNASGGTGTLTYSWNTTPSQSTITATGLGAGTYIVIVNDGLGCANSAQVVITEPTLITANVSAVDVLCNGIGSGSATISSSGGTGAHVYSWSTTPSQINFTASGLSAGTYTVKTTDANGCTISSTVTITEPTILASNISTSANVSCNAGVDGSATVSVSGGTPNYTYSWSTTPSQTAATATGLSAGTYTVKTTDANGCTITSKVIITEPTILASNISSSTNVSCNAGTDGNATVNVSGGTINYTYSWSTTPSQTAATATGLSAGTYTVKTTDANGCTITSTVTITEPTILVSSISSSTNVSCNLGTNGSATLSASGGTTSYTYSWSTTPSQTNTIATGLSAGTYTVKTTDANGCTITSTVTITEPTILSSSISSSTNVSCNAGANGTATVSASGGTANYTYSWSTIPSQTNITATGLSAGTYTVKTTDVNGCTTTSTVTITEPTILASSISASVNVSCNTGTDGSATVSASGGTTNYTYSWSTIPSQTNVTATGLIAGSYSVMTTDANGCTISSTVTITEPTILASSISTSANVSCNAGTDGSATVSAGGGTVNYTYSWSTTPSQTTITATGLTAGAYTVQTTDANGCTVSSTVTITEPTILVTSISASVNVSCNAGNDGSATVSASGGTTNYTYSWSTIPSQTTTTATGLSAGTYTVNTTDANGCTIASTVTITEPSVLTSSITSNISVNCYGAFDGSATVSASGGTANYTYSWSTLTSQTTATVTGLAAWNYTVQVTDANGCTAVSSLTITEPAEILGTVNTVDATCGVSNGTASITSSGGTGSHMYSWNTTPAQTGLNATGLAAGIYSVTITDVNGCTKVVAFSVNNGGNPIVSMGAHQDVLCNGSTTGDATVIASGGIGTLTYSWNTTPSQSNATATGLGAGVYIVIVNDGIGCANSAQVTITEPPAIAIASSQTDLSCNGNNSGSATVLTSGGAGSHVYSWSTSPAQTTNTVTGLASGVYTVLVTDANACTSSSVFTITEPTILSSTISSSTNVNCNAVADGTATVNASGGTTNYTYSWSTTPSQSSATATGLSAGTYSVQTTDANGCIINSTVTITEPAALTSTISSSANVSCNGGANGSATVSINGGTTNYTYSWSTSPVQTTITATGLSAGTYTVETTDVNGCTVTSTVIITEPTILASNISSSTNVSCNTVADGSATVIISGGTMNYSYSWSTIPNQTNATATGLVAGSYTVQTTDANGCIIISTVTITEPTVLASSITTNVSANCYGSFDGSATVAANGGTGSYTYSWSTLPSQTQATATGLAAWNYTVQVTDANGCTTTSSLAITEPVEITSNVITADATCGVANGTASVTTSGGTGVHSYLWNTTPVQSGLSATGLAAGIYSVTITDANGCTKVQAFSINNGGNPVVSIGASQDVLCYGAQTGSATVIAVGGTGTLTYSWNSTPAQTTATATGLPAGTYIVIVSDSLSCANSAQVTITEPTIISIATSQVDILCNGLSTGSANVSVSGGAGSYSYSWNTSLIQTTSNATGLIAGAYTVEITDANGCIADTTITITEPTLLTSTPGVVSNVSCNGGADGGASVNVVGGTGAYAYSWSTSPIQTNSSATGLAAGVYTVLVSDVNGCTDTSVITITEPAILSSIISSSNNVSCNGAGDGSAAVNAAGGVGTYTYSWNTSPAQTIDTATGLSAGIYSVEITDANGCIATSTVSISEPLQLSPTISASTNISCNAGSDGSATVNVTGGTLNYSYSWSTLPTQTNSIATGLVAGVYTVEVTDANGCTDASIVILTEPTLLTSTITSSVDATCNGYFNGGATVAASGGTGSYTYSWSTLPSQTQATATGLAAWSYTVQITDASGCTSSSTISITEPTILSASIATVNATCGDSNGTATITPQGGTPGYSYAWNVIPAQTDLMVTGLYVGIYSVTVTDTNGCTSQQTFSINNGGNPVVNMGTVQNVVCYGDSTGTANVIATGGLGSYTYSWNTVPPQTTSMATGLPLGSYIVLVFDSIGCANSAQVSITQPSGIIVSVNSVTDVSCYGSSDGEVSISTNGGGGSYSYSWNTTPVQTNSLVTGLSAGVYQFEVVDINGCKIDSTVVVSEPPILTSSVASTTDVTCNGGDDGSAVVSVGGGTSSYTYSWSVVPLQTTLSATGLSAGTYTVEIKDGNGCITTTNATITEPSLLTATINTVDATCAVSNGTANITSTGGIGSHSYSWNTTPPQMGASVTGLGAGIYSVTVTDLAGCSKEVAFAVNNGGNPAVAIDTVLNVICNGSSTGAASVIASGGTGTLTYFWNTAPSQTSSSATGLAAGTYIVLVSDSLSCANSALINITEPTPVSVDPILVVDAKCFGSADGSANVTVTGGVGSYVYSWIASSQTTSNVTGLSAGVYSVNVTDANGCLDTLSVTITQPTQLISTASQSGLISCNGANDGEAIVLSSGGTGVYSYSWSTSTPQSITTATGLSAGNYNVEVTDANGCTSQANVTITEPMVITTNIVTVDASCGVANGVASATSSGGNGSFVYSWNTSPLQTGSSASGLSAGIYTLSVTDAKGCTSNVAFAVNNGGNPFVSIDSLQNVKCYGDNSGVASVLAVGGSGTLTYYWNTTPPQTTAIATGLPAGSYIAMVTDSLSCANSVSITISEPTQIITSITSTDITCFGANNGTASVVASGGANVFAYSWNTSPVQTNASATNLPSGNYVVDVLDSLGCIVSLNTQISEPTEIVSQTSIVNTICGDSIGSIAIAATGGQGSYSYSWSNSPSQTASVATGLSSGVYFVTVSDSLGCTDTLTAIVTEPSSLQLVLSSVDAMCGNSNGSATVSVSGGVGVYSYSWFNNPAHTNSSITGLTAGSYSVQVTDSVGCKAIQSVQVGSTPSLNVTASVTNISCYGLSNGNASANVVGGNGILNYVWSTNPVQTTYTATGLSAGNYQVIVFDSLGCSDTNYVSIFEPTSLSYSVSKTDLKCYGDNAGVLGVSVFGGTGVYTYSWNSGAQTSQVSGLSAGNYSVVVTDANSCSIVYYDTLLQPTPIAATATIVDVNCNIPNSGRALVSANGGAGNLSYSWSTTPIQTTSSATGLAAGNYSLTIIDTNNCVFTLPVVVNNKPNVSAQLTSQSTTCGQLNGLINATISGGTSPFTYSWLQLPGVNSLSVDSLAPGYYTFSVIDSVGCKHIDSVLVLSNPVPIADAGDDRTVIEGTPVQLSGFGGVLYYWQPSAGMDCYTCPEPVISPTTTTTYTLSIVDHNGCIALDSVTIFVEEKCSDLFLPNAFSPNGDGVNDLFIARNKCTQDFYLVVYDRWGEKVFETNDQSIGWDGTYKGELMDAGVFVYYVRVGYKKSDKIIERKGNVTLVK